MSKVLAINQPIPEFKRGTLDINILNHIKYNKSKNVVSELTRRNLTTIGRKFNQYLIDTSKSVNPKSIKEFLKELKIEQSPSTWNLSRQNLKTVLKYQPSIRGNYLNRVIIDEIFTDINPMKLEKKIVDYLSYDDVLSLIHCSSTTEAIIIEFLFKTGCRISELINIRIMDCFYGDEVRVRVLGKGSKVRVLYIGPDLFNRIRNHFQGKVYLFENSNHHLFDRSNLYRKIKTAGKRVLNQNIHPHILRHSTANYLLLDCGKSAKFVSEYLGHSTPAITMEMYIHDKPGSEVVELFNRKELSN